MGVEVHRDRKIRRLYLSQRKHVREILQKFNMSEARPISTPLDKKGLTSQRTSPSAGSEKIQDMPYINVVGALNYLATCTRPDISYAVGALGSFSAKPEWEHWLAAKRVMRYLQGTQDLCLSLGSDDTQSRQLKGYSDADYAGDVDKRRSTSGYAFFIGDSLVSWRSKRQSVVALSTTEAEYIAAVSAGQEAMSLRNLIAELGYLQKSGTTIYMDNQSAIRVAKNPEHQSRIKHMDIRFHWLRQQVQHGHLNVEYVPTQDMAADTSGQDFTSSRCSGPWISQLQRLSGSVGVSAFSAYIVF